MINFVMILSELWLYVLDIWVKSGVGLSADHHLEVSWIKWQERLLDRLGKPKQVAQVNWECLVE